MRKPNLAEDLIPIGEFKTHASELLRQLHAHRRPLVITQNGRAAAIVLTPEDFEALGYREYVKAKVLSGIASAAKDGAVSSKEVRARLKARVRGESREG